MADLRWFWAGPKNYRKVLKQLETGMHQLRTFNWDAEYFQNMYAQKVGKLEATWYETRSGQPPSFDRFVSGLGTTFAHERLCELHTWYVKGYLLAYQDACKTWVKQQQGGRFNIIPQTPSVRFGIEVGRVWSNGQGSNYHVVVCSHGWAALDRWNETPLAKGEYASIIKVDSTGAPCETIVRKG